jgi:hypothetical protein
LSIFLVVYMLLSVINRWFIIKFDICLVELEYWFRPCLIVAVLWSHTLVKHGRH